MFARVSTQDQNLDLQKDALLQIGCERIFTDIASGAKSSRTGLDDALGFLREGDTLVVWRLDRLGRSLKHLIEVVNSLNEKNISFKSLQENIDTSTSGESLFFMFLVHLPNLNVKLYGKERKLDYLQHVHEDGSEADEELWTIKKYC